MADLGPEPGLLHQLASQAFEKAGYRTSMVSIAEFDAPVLVAKDPYVTVGVITPERLEDSIVELTEQQLSFANWAMENHGGDHRWDLYLVVLSSSKIEQNLVADVEALASDVRFVRKIVRGAVIPTVESVETALAPFLPVPLVRWQEHAQPLDELELEIRRRGVDPGLIAAALESFRETGRVRV